MTTRTAVPLTELRRLLPAIHAGARALRERERWATRSAFLHLTADQARADAERLEDFARSVSSRPRGGR